MITGQTNGLHVNHEWDTRAHILTKVVINSLSHSTTSVIQLRPADIIAEGFRCIIGVIMSNSSTFEQRSCSQRDMKPF